MFRRPPFLLLFLVVFQPALAGNWRQGLESIDAARDTLFKERHPGFVTRPLSEQSVDIIGGRTYGIDKRAATLEEKEVICKSIIRTAVMHPRMHFFEQKYALAHVTDDRYYAHLTACYIVDTAVQLLEGQSERAPLALNLYTYFQRMLAYKGTPLQTLVGEALATQVLSVLERYTQADYQRLLTDHFIQWYQDVTASYPQDRAQYGIKMDVLPPPRDGCASLEISYKKARDKQENVKFKLAISDAYRVFGSQRATRDTFTFESKLGKEFSELPVKYFLSVSRFDAIWDLFEHASFSQEKTDRDTLGSFFYDHWRSYMEKISRVPPRLADYILRRVIILVRQAKAWNEAHKDPNLRCTELEAYAEAALGQALYRRVDEKALSHEARVALYDESLQLLRHALSLGYEHATVNLSIVALDYKAYLLRQADPRTRTGL